MRSATLCCSGTQPGSLEGSRGLDSRMGLQGPWLNGAWWTNSPAPAPQDMVESMGAGVLPGVPLNPGSYLLTLQAMQLPGVSVASPIKWG